jgi:hypothetical protein
MKYSLRSLMTVVALAPPGLAILWWLRHTWLVQVWLIIVLGVVVLSTGCLLTSALIAVTQRLARMIAQLAGTRPKSAKESAGPFHSP